MINFLSITPYILFVLSFVLGEKRWEEIGCCIAPNSKIMERFSESSASINLVKDTKKN